MRAWRSQLAHLLPFYYGWVIAGNTVAVSLSTRTVMAVALLSVFVVPMTEGLGWSRGLFSGAVSLGGLAAVVASPFVGKWLDRYGAGVIISASSVVTGMLAIGLAFVAHPVIFYLLYVPGRMVFAGPLELGLPTAISNWFIRRRPLGLAVDAIAKGAGLAVMPVVAQLIITGWDWRTAWVVIAIIALALGVLPPLLLVARRPEDMGLEPDPAPVREAASGDLEDSSAQAGGIDATTEVNFTVHQAMRTRSFWILAIFSGASMMVQAGISLHQVSHYINQGISGPSAALTASMFAFGQIPASVFWSALARRVPLRFLLAGSAFLVAVGAVGTIASATVAPSLASALGVGFGVGGLHLLIRLAWADYYGREHLGAIRGWTMSAQVGGQALGPVLAGFLYDYTKAYRLPFTVFAVAVSLAGLLALLATPPRLPQRLEAPVEPAASD